MPPSEHRSSDAQLLTSHAKKENTAPIEQISTSTVKHITHISLETYVLCLRVEFHVVFMVQIISV